MKIKKLNPLKTVILFYFCLGSENWSFSVDVDQHHQSKRIVIELQVGASTAVSDPNTISLAMDSQLFVSLKTTKASSLARYKPYPSAMPN